MDSQADQLRAAGWRVIEGEPQTSVLAPGANEATGWQKIDRNSDGSLHLVPQRSSLHKQIAAVLK